MRQEQGHWLARGYDQLDDWLIVDDEPWKDGVRQVHVFQLRPREAGEYRIVYVTATEIERRLYMDELKIKCVMDKSRDQCEHILAKTMRTVLAELHAAHFPKRRFKLIDAMGTTCLWIDKAQLGELEWLFERCAPLRELDRVMTWFASVSSYPNVEIEDINIAPLAS